MEQCCLVLFLADGNDDQQDLLLGSLNQQD